jgi:hypothetical protein
MTYRDRVEFLVLQGKTLTEIKGGKDTDKLRFFTTDGEEYLMYHNQDCCENVILEDICGDLDDLIGSPILQAEEVVSDKDPEDFVLSDDDRRWRESYTWTFYKLATIKGAVTLRWYGESNGYYSESVDFELVDRG